MEVVEIEKIKPKKVRCPYCGHPVNANQAEDAVCKGIFFKCKNKECRKIFELLKANKLDPNLKIVTSRSTFDKRIHSLKPASEYEDDGTVEYGVRVIKGLSM